LLPARSFGIFPRALDTLGGFWPGTKSCRLSGLDTPALPKLTD
jgi:hypothetical protein